MLIGEYAPGTFLTYFVHCESGFIKARMAADRVEIGVVERTSLLRAGAAAWVASMRQRGRNIAASSTRERERPEYVVAQLAHALLTEVALDCGYPSSALKERIYVLPMAHDEPLKCAVLIYTATAGSQGTLGGLVETTSRFAVGGIATSGLAFEPL